MRHTLTQAQYDTVVDWCGSVSLDPAKTCDTMSAWLDTLEPETQTEVLARLFPTLRPAYRRTSKKFNEGYTMHQEDRLLDIWFMPGGSAIRRGKRLPNTCPLSRAEVREYVAKGTIPCVRLIKEGRGISLYEAHELFKSARGEVRKWNHA